MTISFNSKAALNRAMKFALQYQDYEKYVEHVDRESLQFWHNQANEMHMRLIQCPLEEVESMLDLINEISASIDTWTEALNTGDYSLHRKVWE